MSWNDSVQGGGGRLLYEAMICRQCEAGAASAFRAPLSRMRGARRDDAPVALARAGAIYLATGFGLSASAAGRAFGRHRSTVDHACRRIGERCDTQPDFAIAIDCMSHALARRIAAVAREAMRCTDDASAWCAGSAWHEAPALQARGLSAGFIPAPTLTTACQGFAGGAQ